MAKNEQPREVTVKISLDVSEDTPVYYANYVEVGHSQHDFGLSFVRVPVKFPPAVMAEVEKSQKVTLTSDVHIVLPHAVAAGLVNALQKQLASAKEQK